MHPSGVSTSPAPAGGSPPSAYPTKGRPAWKAQAVATSHTAPKPHAKRDGAPRRGSEAALVMKRNPESQIRSKGWIGHSAARPAIGTNRNRKGGAPMAV